MAWGGAADRTSLRVYSADGAHEGWRVMVRDLWQGRELVWRLLVRDVSARYRQSYLGYAWALMPAIATALVFGYLRSRNVLAGGEFGIPYAAYVLLGMMTWQVFSGGLTAAAHSLTTAGNLVSKVRFPRETLVLAAVGGALFDAGVRALLVAFTFAYYGVVPAATAWLLPLVWLPLVLLVTGLGFVVALANALVRDVGNGLAVLLNLFFFLVPIVSLPAAGLLTDANPVAALLIAAHDVVLVGTLSHPVSFAWACGVSPLAFFGGWWLFRAAQPLIAERI